MARHLIKRKKAGHWYAVQRYNGFNEDGQPALKEKWFPLQNARGETLTVDTPLRTVEQTLRTLELQLHRNPQTERAVDLRTDEACDEFLRSKEHSVRAGTLRSYRLWLVRFCESSGHVTLSALAASHVEKFKLQLIDDGLAVATVNIALRNLRTFLNWALKRDLIPKSPMRHVDFVRSPSRSVLPSITWAQFESDFLPVVENPRHAAAFGLAIYAGLRREEICHLRWSDIDFETDTIHILSADGFETKSGRSRQVPMYPPLRKLLEAIPRTMPYVVSANKAKPDSSVISHRWLDLQRAVNAKRPEAGKYPHLRLHDLRGSFCTELLRRMAPAVVQQVMGHADIQTTMRHYSHLTSTMAVDAARKIRFD